MSLPLLTFLLLVAKRKKPARVQASVGVLRVCRSHVHLCVASSVVAAPCSHLVRSMTASKRFSQGTPIYGFLADEYGSTTRRIIGHYRSTARATRLSCPSLAAHDLVN